MSVVLGDSLSAVVALLVLWMVGLGLSFAITGRDARLGAALRLSVAFALGVGAVAVGMFVTSLCGVRWGSPAWLVSPWLLPVALLGWRKRGGDPVGPLASGGGRGARLWHAVLIGVLLWNLAVVAWIALDKPVWSYDAISRWMFKAKAFYHERSVIPYFQDLERGVTQPHYPPLVSLAASYVYLWLGHEEDRLVKVFFVAVFAALLAGVYGLVRRRSSRGVALLAPVVLSLAPAMTYLDWPPGVGAHSAMADVPLALFTLLAFGLWIEWWRSGQRSLLVLAWVLSALCPWTKQEGALVPALLCAATLVALLTRHRQRGQLIGFGAGLTLAAAVALPWQWFQRTVPVTDEVYLATRFDLDAIRDHADRLPAIAREFGVEVLRTEHWNLLWPLVVLALVLAPRAALRNGAALIAVIIVLHLSAYAVVYAIEDFKGQGLYRQKMAISLTRLFMHVAPLAACVIGLQIAALASRASSPDEGAAR